jgi:hypothetical protein
MDFHQLLDRLNKIESRPQDQINTETCGTPPPLPPQPTETPIPPPSLSVNLNAQGMDNIEQMMKLFQKVNPDMMPKAEPMPSIAPLPSIMSIRPELPPLKMLPDFDADNDDKVGGEMDIEIEPMGEPKGPMMKMDLDKDDDEGSQPGGLGASLDRDGDGDHDMDDHDLEKNVKKEALPAMAVRAAASHSLSNSEDSDDEDEEDKKEAWANEPDEEEKDVDYMVNKLAGGMNKSHGTYPKVARGDNPMQRITRMEGEDLRAQIRDELRKRLAETKGAK